MVAAGNKDRPTKEMVDQQQEELEAGLTWADRWYRNKKVQKVVKDSKIMSKVRTKIKLKEFKLKPPPAAPGEQEGADGAGGSSTVASNEELPRIIGSIEEYKRILGRPDEGDVGDYPKAAAAAAAAGHADESEESAGEEDELWGAIMGGTGKDDD